MERGVGREEKKGGRKARRQGRTERRGKEREIPKHPS